MSVLRDIGEAIVAKLNTASGIVGTLVIFITPLASFAFRGNVPDQIRDVLPLIVFCSVAALLFVFWLMSYAWQALFASHDYIFLPKMETVVYPVVPYSSDSHLNALSLLAGKLFGGDTMRPEVVQHAVASKCAVGLRLTDQTQRTIGFVDVFRLQPDSLQAWLYGRLSETQLKDSDFRPLAEGNQSGETLELILGAIYIEQKTLRREPRLAFQLAELAQDHLWKTCPGWEKIRIYSSIFSESGQELAALYGFAISIFKKDREGAGKDHDVWARTSRRSDPPRTLSGLGGRRNIVMQVKSD
jgi:hypothetical protein